MAAAIPSITHHPVVKTTKAERLKTMIKSEYELERARIARAAERNTVQKRAEFGLRQQQPNSTTWLRNTHRSRQKERRSKTAASHPMTDRRSG